MTANEKTPQPETRQWTSSLQSSTVQVLVVNEGNRRVIRDMLTDDFDVDTSHSIQGADLYLVEDQLFEKYRDELREKVTQSHPVFCPVVIIRRDQATEIVDWTETDGSESELPLLVDEFVEAPISRRLLVSRLRSLLVRREQSLELLNQVATLERQERDLRRFEHAVEDSGTATAITDTEGVIEYVNSEFETLTGYDRSDAIRRPLERFVVEDSIGTVDASFWQTVANESEWRGEIIIERKADQQRITDTTITPIRDTTGDVEGFVVVMPDITQRVEQEQLLRDRQQELDLLRQILSRYLRHNLRNDLNIILGYAELLEERLPEQDGRDATKIRQTTKRLIERSETARKYSTLIEEESELTPHNVSQIVEEAVSETREQYPDISIEVEMSDECYVLARYGIEEAIRGLIDNAARHNTADSPRVQITVIDSDSVQIEIEDNGPGISALELETLEQGTETALKHSQGIGLWLSKWVVERVDGQLSFATMDEGGTRVTVDFSTAEELRTHGVAVSDLKAREQRLQTITNRMTDAVLEVDAAWNITYADEQAESILGINADAVLGQDFWDVFSAVRDTEFETVYQDVMRSRSATRIEEYYSGIDGWIEVYVYPDFDGGLSLYIRDVTERKERERELEQAYSRIEMALEVTDAAVWEWNLETDAVTMHPERDPVFETKIRTLDDSLEWVHPDDRSKVRSALTTAIETGSPYDVEYRIQSGETARWVADYGEVQYDDDGNAYRMIGVVREITERKEREAELELKSKAMDEAPSGITITDPARDDNPIIYANSQFKRLTGYSEAETLGRNCRFLQGENTAAERVTEMREAIAADESVTVELRNYRKDGTEFWDRVSIAPVRADDADVTHFVGFQQDVSDQKERERLFKAVFNNSYTLTGVMDLDGILQEANATALSFAGIDRADVIGKPIWETYWFQENRTARETARKAVRKARQGELFRDEIRVQGADDAMIIDFTVRPIFDEDGAVTLLIPEGRDITELKEREQQLQSIIDNLPGYVYRHKYSSEYPLQFVKGDAEGVTGYTTTELEEDVTIAEEIIHPDDRDSLWAEHVEGIEADGRFDSTYRIITKDGDVRWIRDQGQLLEGSVTGDEFIDGFITDVSSDHTEAETPPNASGPTGSTDSTCRELQEQNERLSEFAGVVSHDLQTPLSVVKGRVSLAREGCEDEHLDAIESAADRMGRMIDDLLWLADQNRNIGATNAVVIQDVIENAWRIVADSVSRAKVTYADAGFAAATIEADQDRLYQLFENVLRNAVEHAGSDVTVTIGLLDDGFYVEDDGSGIPIEERGNVFDVGYSTRESNTGFGLWIVRRVIDAHGWEIRIKESDNGGARFEITSVVFTE